MPVPPLRTVGLSPGAASLKALVSEFRARGHGVVTACSDPLLPTLDSFSPSDSGLEVLTLGETAHRFLKACDENPRGIARSGQVTAAIAESCEALDSDSPFAASSRHPGFHRALGRVLDELRKWRITPAMLQERSLRAEPRTAAKMRSLAEIELSVESILEALGRETAATQLARSLGHEPAKGCSFERLLFVAGSTDEPLLADWLRWASEHGCELWVALDRAEQGANLYQGAARMEQMLGGALEARGQANDLSRSLFTDRGAGSGPRVTISSCVDALSEAEWALRSCRSLLDNGAGLSEIGIYVRDIEQYSVFLQASAARLDVPIRISPREACLTNRFAALLLGLLRFCAGNDCRALISWAGSSYFDLTWQGREKLRSATREAYRARANQWPLLRGWAQTNEADLPWLIKLLDWRAEAVKEERPMYAWVQMLRTLGDMLLGRAAGNVPTGPRDGRIMTALQRPLANIASVRRVTGDRPISLGRFVEACETAWTDEEYTVPGREQGVLATSNAEALPELSSLFVLGVLEGVFPRRRSEEPILSDRERHEISKVLSLKWPLQDSFHKAKEERDEFHRVCSSARDSLWFSYPQADDNRDNVPAFYLTEVERAAGQVTKIDHPRSAFPRDWAECICDADKALHSSRSSPERDEPLQVAFTSAAVAGDFAWAEDKPFSPQDLRDAMRCEFRHFASRRLKLRPVRGANRWFSLVKLPKVARLLQQPNRERAIGALEAAMEAELDELYGELPEWEVALMRSGGKRLIREWVDREFTARDLWPRNSSVPDVPFGAPGLQNVMPGGVSLTGTVAGVSKIGPYAVAHVYEPRAPKSESRLGGAIDEVDALYYGLLLLARHMDGPTAVDVESVSGMRTLLVLPRVPQQQLPSKIQAGLRVIDLGAGADPTAARRSFYEDVKRRLRRAAERLKASGIEPSPGEHCRWCGYGELCRRSHYFGESDSPFGSEHATGIAD